jgi:cephalosporin-C deacetylase-like acetyl esterase
MAVAALPPSQPSYGDRMIAEYFRLETAKLAERCLADIKTLDDWTSQRGNFRQQLFEMLGLWPVPAKTDLKPVITGRVEHESFTVEKLQFQSMPGLYVTANLYLPKHLTKPAPAVLYVCGHARIVTNGVSFGNKVGYQQHGAWFARNGYVCLLIDTLQLGEIEGLHHGTYREAMWWWNSRGYTPAGVEAWNSIRAIDYLQSRPEVDPDRIGITGRSGGGAYSWMTAALDERIKVAAPVAGITDLQNHVVDGVIEGHCDCMFFVHTHRWDYPQLAALLAPRPLLIVNSDSDNIFPLDGVLRVHAKVRKIYDLYKAKDKLGLVIGPGPHKDTQELQLPVFHWFNRFLKNDDPVIEMAAVKLFTPEQLRVWTNYPSDQINQTIQNTFVPTAKAPPIPESKETWQSQRDAWLSALKEKTFAGWPEEAGSLNLQKAFSAERDGIRFEAYDFDSQPTIRLRLYLLQDAKLRQPERIVLSVLGKTSEVGNAGTGGPSLARLELALLDWENWLATAQTGFGWELREELGVTSLTPRVEQNGAHWFADSRQMLQTNKSVLAYIAPRGLGRTAWGMNEAKRTHIRRRFMLLGQTLDGMRVWDVRRAIQALSAIGQTRDMTLAVQGNGAGAGIALYASLFETSVTDLDLYQLPKSHSEGPELLNVLRFLDLPHAVAMAAERCRVTVRGSQNAWDFPVMAAARLGWKPTAFQIVPLD